MVDYIFILNAALSLVFTWSYLELPGSIQAANAAMDGHLRGKKADAYNNPSRSSNDNIPRLQRGSLITWLSW